MGGESLVPKDTPRVIHAKAPLDDPMLLLRTAAPCRDERDEIDERRDAPLPEALARDEARFELGGIEPARVLGRVVHDETLPEPPPLKVSEQGVERGAGVDVEIVHDEV